MITSPIPINGCQSWFHSWTSMQENISYRVCGKFEHINVSWWTYQNKGLSNHFLACKFTFTFNMWHCSIVMRKTRDSGFNHPWGGQKKSWGAIPRALPEGWPRRIFFGPRRVIEDRIPSLTPDNDILHQFKASSAAGGMIISIIIPRELIMIITPLGMKLWILSSLPASTAVSWSG